MRIDRIVLGILLLCATCSAQRVWRDGKWKRTETREVIDMAQPRWIGQPGGSKDFNDDSNWNTGSAPVAGQTFIFDENGQGDCTIGMAQGAKADMTITRKPGYLGQLGSPGNPLVIDGTFENRLRIGVGAKETHIAPNDPSIISISGDMGSSVFLYGSMVAAYTDGCRITFDPDSSVGVVRNSGAIVTMLAPAELSRIMQSSGTIIVSGAIAPSEPWTLGGGTIFLTGSYTSGEIHQTRGRLVITPSVPITNLIYVGIAGIIDFEDSAYTIDFSGSSLFGADLDVLQNQGFSFDGLDLRKTYP